MKQELEAEDETATWTKATEDFSRQAFGCPDFKWRRSQGGSRGAWAVLCNFKDPVELGGVMVYHATTLSQCHTICDEGFKVGKWHKGTKSSPCGIWGCDDPGHSFDRCPLTRGWTWSANRSDTSVPMCGWNCPVAFAGSFPQDAFHTQKARNRQGICTQRTTWNAVGCALQVHRNLDSPRRV